MYTKPVPLQAPDELAHHTHPAYDRAGVLLDWRLASIEPGYHTDDASFRCFRAWRSTFAEDHFLGERALILAVLAWLEPRVDISALSVLRRPSGQVDFRSALSMKIQVKAAERAVAASPDNGLGLCVRGSHHAMRVLVPTQPATRLLGLGASSLTVGSDGLTLHAPDPDATVPAITQWHSFSGGVRLIGDGREVNLVDPDATTLLRVAGRHADTVEVHETPLRTLLAPMLAAVHTAASLAGRTGADLHLRSGCM